MTIVASVTVVYNARLGVLMERWINVGVDPEVPQSVANGKMHERKSSKRCMTTHSRSKATSLGRRPAIKESVCKMLPLM